jgi:hypothetical protein
VDVSVLFLFLSQGCGKLGEVVTRQSEGEGGVPVYYGDGSRGGEDEDEEDAGSGGVSRSEGEGGLEGWDPKSQEWQRVGSWVCMKQVLSLLVLLVQSANTDADRRWGSVGRAASSPPLMRRMTRLLLRRCRLSAWVRVGCGLGCYMIEV